MKNNNVTLILFSLTLFLSASLMFGLQPMIGKMLLPIVGGTPAGWVVAMAFFQVTLLAGYFFAHVLSRLSPRLQGIVYICGLGLGCFFLPVSLAAHANLVSDRPMAPDIFLLLSAAVAVPFAALSATASTLQRLFTTTSHASAKDPYFLYAASNLGSFAGLLLYPLVIEPGAGLKVQTQGWFFGYGLLICAAVVCLALTGKGQTHKKAMKSHATGVPWKTRLEWLALSFVPSSLMMAVTTHITVNIFSAPLIWTLPLGLYLITFVIAFGNKKIISYNNILTLQPIAVACALLLVYTHTPIDRFIPALPMVWQLLAFTVIALMCHMRLAQKRPLDKDRHHLTEFYFMMSLGGALGGVLNAFIVPFVLNRMLEYPLMLAFSCLLHPAFKKKAGTLLALCLQPRTIFIGGLVVILVAELVVSGKPVAVTRNFYGVVKVMDKPYPIDGKTYTARIMLHGPILHGFQVRDEKYARSPTSYFSAKGPVGDVFSLTHPQKVAVLGLGTGTINCFAPPGSTFTFFEIDPAVISMAKEYFTFLSACGKGNPPRLILGDARLELARLRDEKFDLIILDTFSGDSIPVHLLSVEALQLYRDHLETGGIMLFNISNRFLSLADTVAVTGQSAGLKNLYKLNLAKDDPLALTSRWIALAGEESTLAPLKLNGWGDRKPPSALQPWTDDYTNLLSTLHF